MTQGTEGRATLLTGKTMAVRLKIGHGRSIPYAIIEWLTGLRNCSRGLQGVSTAR